MNNHTEEQAILNLIEGMNKLKGDALKREEMKRWKPIEVPLPLNNALNRLTRNELDSIRKKLEIKNSSSLKKAELILRLQEKIPALLEAVCKQLDQERYRLAKSLVRQGGHMNAILLEENQLNYFLELGMIFTGTFEGKKVFVMPQEIVAAFSELDELAVQTIFKRNTEWIKLTQGLLYYYGSLKLAKLIEFLESYLKKPIYLLEYLNVIYQAASYYEEIRMEDNCFSNYRVFDSKKVLKEHMMRKNLEYFLFSKDQLLKAGEPGFVERNESYNRFVQFLLDNYEMKKDEAELIAEECVYATRIGDKPQDLLQYLQSRLEFNSIEELSTIMERIVDLMNNTREWFLKGYTPTELHKEEQKSLIPLKSKDKAEDYPSEKKVGRNDPCPCGSGKKYKKCCGK